MNEIFPYEDIVNIPHPKSRTHPHMSMANRAAQFAPFAALTGHDEAIAESARTTISKSDMSLEQLQLLSRKLSYALSFPDRPAIYITYFKPDDRKSGGEYHTIIGAVKRVEETYNILALTNGVEIPLDSISDIRGEIFNDIDI